MCYIFAWDKRNEFYIILPSDNHVRRFKQFAGYFAVHSDNDTYWHTNSSCLPTHMYCKEYANISYPLTAERVYRRQTDP